MGGGMTHSTRLMPQRPDAMGDFRHSPFTVAWDASIMVCSRRRSGLHQ